MHDQAKTKTQLIDELQALRRRIAELEAIELEHKRATESLRMSDVQFRNLIENSIQGILVHQNTKPLFANQTFAHILGYQSSEEILKMDSVVPLIAPYEQERLLGYHQARKNGDAAPVHYEYDALCKDGSIITLQNSVTTINWEGQPAVMSITIDITEHKRIDETLYFVAQRGWALDGETFFRSLTQYLAKTLELDYAFIGELTKDGTSVRTVALYAQGQMADNIEYNLKGTPCENVVGQKLCCYTQGVQQLFPQDDLLVEMGVESYLGIPLWDSAGNPLGIIVVLGRKPLNNPSPAEAILQIVAVRAAHELERQLAEEELRRRNRELNLLNQIIAASATDSEPEVILETACRELAKAFDSPRATAILFNKETKTGTIVAKYRAESQLDSDEKSIIETGSIIDYLFDHRAPLVVNDAQNDLVLAKNQDMLRRFGIKSILVIPLVIEDEVIGSLNMGSKQSYAFSTEDVNLAWRVTEQIAGALTRARLTQTRQLLTTAIEQSAESVMITDTKGNILYINPAFQQTTGYSYAEVIGRNPRILKSGKQNDAFYRDLWNTLTAGQLWHGHFVNKRKDGSFYTEEAAITPVRDKNGIITNYVAVKRDVTGQLQLEEQYRQAQKMEAIGRLAGGVAHDFNNLLTAIMGYVGLIQAELSPDNAIYNDIEGIQNTAQRAASLTRQLLTFARRQIVEAEVLNLNDLILNLDKLLRRLIGEDIELVTLPAFNLGQIKADPGQIEQVIINLVINARDAMPHGGKLTIETANISLNQNYAQHHAGVTPGEYVMLTISDTGQGMTAEVKEHIFEPFFTTKDQGKGTGLGLATCFGIVKQSAGHIWVYSEEGQGTTFKIYLPRIEEAAGSTFRRDKLGDIPTGTETILLVEDEPSVRDLAARILRQQSYTVLEAAHGEEALRLLQEQPTLKINLLLTDVIMPQMGGKVLADKVVAMYPNIKVIFISGYTDNAILHHGILDAGGVFLQKPFSPIALARKVREALDQ